MVEQEPSYEFDFPILMENSDAESFPFERCILLFEFQTWIYTPKKAQVKKRKLARALAGGRFLERLGQEYLNVKGPGRNSARLLMECLQDKKYELLYNNSIKKLGGWTGLLHESSLTDFDETLMECRREVETVAQIMDYRFRYFDHGGENKQQGNISHGQFFRWSDKKLKLSGRTIRTRWGRYKQSAVFLYVSEHLKLDFFPPKVHEKNFIDEMSARANDLEQTRRFLGTCAYVADKLRGSDPNDVWLEIPTNIERIRPETLPLSSDELERMKQYKEMSPAFRDG